MASLIFYFTIFTIVFIINSAASSLYKKNKIVSKILIFISFLILLLIQGLRYKVGTDYEAYLDYYNLIKYSSWKSLFLINWEYGALIIFKLASFLYETPTIMFFIIGFLNLYPLYRVNKLYEYKYLSYSILTFCCLFLPFCLNGMRQGIAMGFVLLSFMYLIEQKQIKSIIALVTAILFHKTAVLIIPYIIIYKLFKEKNFGKYCIVLSITLSIVILFFLKDFFAENDILTYSYYLNDININNISIKVMMFYIPVIILMLLFSKRKQLYHKVSSTLVVSGIFFDIIGTSAKYLTRISLYFTFFQILLLPYLIQNIKNNDTKKIIKVLYVVYLILYFIIQFYMMGKHEIFPYRIINFS